MQNETGQSDNQDEEAAEVRRNAIFAMIERLRLIPGRKRIPYKQIAELANIDYAYFHSYISGKRGRKSGFSVEKGEDLLNAMEKLGALVTREDRQDFLALVLRLSDQYRVVKVTDAILDPEAMQFAEAYRGTTPEVQQAIRTFLENAPRNT